MIIVAFTSFGPVIFNIPSLDIKGTLYDGTTDATSNVTTWQWSKFINNTYVVIPEATSSTITILNSEVNTYASFRCVANYNGTQWIDAPNTDLPTGTYTWSYRDKDGNPILSNTLSNSGKVIYIDGTMVGEKLIADVRVETGG